MAARVKLTCENCGTTATELTMRDTDGKFVCVPCVPASTWAAYPGSKARALAKLKRAEQAKRNFAK